MQTAHPIYSPIVHEPALDLAHDYWCLLATDQDSDNAYPRTPMELFTGDYQTCGAMFAGFDACGAVAMRWQTLYGRLGKTIDSRVLTELQRTNHGFTAGTNLFMGEISWSEFLSALVDANLTDMFTITINKINEARANKGLSSHIKAAVLLQSFKQGVRPLIGDVRASLDSKNPVSDQVKKWAALSNPVTANSICKFKPFYIAKFLAELHQSVTDLDQYPVRTHEELQQWLQMKQVTAIQVRIAAERSGEVMAARDAELSRITGSSETFDVPINHEMLMAVAAGQEPNSIVHAWVDVGEAITSVQAVKLRTGFRSDKSLADLFTVGLHTVTGKDGIGSHDILSNGSSLIEQLGGEVTCRAARLVLTRMNQKNIADAAGLPTLETELGIASKDAGDAEMSDSASVNASSLRTWLLTKAKINEEIVDSLLDKFKDESVYRTDDLEYMTPNEFKDVLTACGFKLVPIRKMLAAFERDFGDDSGNPDSNL